MDELTDETRDKILIDTARLVAATAKAVAPLIEREQPNPSPLGGETYLPDYRQTGLSQTQMRS